MGALDRKAMPSLTVFIAPFALLLPAVVDIGTGNGDDANRLLPREAGEEQIRMSADSDILSFETVVRDPVNNQVRIERRVIIRVAPQSRVRRQDMASNIVPRQDPRQQMTERKIGKCLQVAGIAAVQPTSGNRLMLFMRDQRLMTARLEKACSARDFYSGFYVEKSKDGKLCVDRDKIRSRTGANCEIDRLRQLVAVNN